MVAMLININKFFSEILLNIPEVRMISTQLAFIIDSSLVSSMVICPSANSPVISKMNQLFENSPIKYQRPVHHPTMTVEASHIEGIKCQPLLANISPYLAIERITTHQDDQPFSYNHSLRRKLNANVDSIALWGKRDHWGIICNALKSESISSWIE